MTAVAGSQQSAKNEQSSSSDQVSAADNEDKEPEVMQNKSEKSVAETENSTNTKSSILQKKKKRTLESGDQEPDVEKKLKYESPLDFLRVPNNKYE